jgi:hypothetical protein
MVLSYARNKYATTTDLEDGALLIRAALEDTVFAGTVEMEVKVPDLEISSVKGEIKRAFNKECQETIPLLQEAVGLRIGSGINKTINDLIGGSEGCPKLADLVLECIDEVVLRFTLPTIRESQSGNWEERAEGTREMLRQNPGLLGSCIAFAKDSPLLEGLELEK